MPLVAIAVRFLVELDLPAGVKFAAACAFTASIALASFHVLVQGSFISQFLHGRRFNIGFGACGLMQIAQSRRAIFKNCDLVGQRNFQNARTQRARIRRRQHRTIHAMRSVNCPFAQRRVPAHFRKLLHRASARRGLRLRGVNGNADDSSRATIIVANRNNTGTGTPNGTVDLTGHPVDVKATNNNIAQCIGQNPGSVQNNIGSFRFNSGTVDAINVNLAVNSQANVNSTGNLVVGSGGTLVVSNLSLVNQTGGTGTGFNASVFDKGGLYVGGDGKWQYNTDTTADVPGNFYSTRISSRQSWIKSIIGTTATSSTSAALTASATAVPEPASVSLLAIGAAAMLKRRRRA
jgi:hypothetical protein